MGLGEAVGGLTVGGGAAVPRALSATEIEPPWVGVGCGVEPVDLLLFEIVTAPTAAAAAPPTMRPAEAACPAATAAAPTFAPALDAIPGANAVEEVAVVLKPADEND